MTRGSLPLHVYNTYMQKKLTLTIDQEIYEALHRRIGPRKISGFIESVVRPLVIEDDLEDGYRQLAADEQSEREAKEWMDGTFEDWINESW